MIGDGPDEADHIATMMAERGLGRRIAMMPAMKARDAFAMAHDRRGAARGPKPCPISCSRRWRPVKPVIASRVGGIPEVLGRQCAALVPAGDSDALARAMADA